MDIIEVMARAANDGTESLDLTRRDIIDALRAAEQSGWRLVPVEPRVAMIQPVACELWRSINPNIDPNEPRQPHGKYPNWYECGDPAGDALIEAIQAAPRPWEES